MDLRCRLEYRSGNEFQALDGQAYIGKRPSSVCVKNRPSLLWEINNLRSTVQSSKMWLWVSHCLLSVTTGPHGWAVDENSTTRLLTRLPLDDDVMQWRSYISRRDSRRDHCANRCRRPVPFVMFCLTTGVLTLGLCILMLGHAYLVDKRFNAQDSVFQASFERRMYNTLCLKKRPTSKPSLSCQLSVATCLR